MLRKNLKIVILSLLIVSSGCTTVNYSKECLGELKIVGLTEEELSKLPRNKQFRIDWNDSMIKEICP